jgi:RHS repeat-associated protein
LKAKSIFYYLLLPALFLKGISVNAAVNINYVVNNHLGAPVLLVDENQHVVWQAEYDEFGKAKILVEEVEFNVRLPGQYYDKETGLSYNYYRDYDEGLGRYVQSDPIGLRGGINTYAYVQNNPVSYTDRYGLDIDGSWGETPPYFPTKEEHANRNKNICPCKKPENGGEWTVVLGKSKHTSGYECKYDAKGNLLADTTYKNPNNPLKPSTEQNYSYNYTPSSYSPMHILQDVMPSYLWPDNYPDNQTIKTENGKKCNECSKD